ncbi:MULTISPECIES: DUF433 domain-containing protein [Pseudanabaena]|jgi:uncharacterized protein (DUF433 family)|uniref:DUF433 domain-containing protein n=1 Tax=Pseudanabaena TaxID=1152 RepID=UPI00247A2DC9|nr:MULTISPECIES: DUF433 domain-containing protein [Pseudanabaena]MEA5488839.1 DUF433 domain-containing protein [Pseudanabaena sp. CCNP1317]WGS74923.1 DUF433 domain-containing protein [Pseudanabaena galeata CCNP1313]
MLAIAPQPIPLKLDADGVVRIGGTRVTLDTIISVYQQGATADEIAFRYPSLKLADVYAAIAYYLNHQHEVETYLTQRQQQAKIIQQTNQARFNPQHLRDRIAARQSTQSA